MSGHSKWANIKRKKAVVDAQKGKVFSKLTREITAAARQGGGNPDGNFRLKTAIDKARASNVPQDNIQRAIQRGSGPGEGEQYEELLYEGYGPGGVAVMVEVLTDNRNRTAGEVRHLFAKHGGNLGESGCVAWMFDQKGLIQVEKEDAPGEDDLLLSATEAGAEDLREDEESWDVVTGVDVLPAVKDALEQGGVKVADAEVTYLPRSTVAVDGTDAERLLRLLDLLEEHDDVQRVHANFEMSDEEMERS